MIVLSGQVSSHDNRPPSFSATQYIFEVSEDASVGDILNASSSLGEILAVDFENDNITYEKVNAANSPQFSLNSTTGSLSVAQSLDREENAFYSFEIFANDSQTEGLLSTVSVHIVILDVNDNQPIFLNTYNFSLDEGVSNGHQVNPPDTPISVTDADIGNNKPSVISIQSGSDSLFTIDQNGNILTSVDDSVGVNRVIDFETKFFYNLTVRATNTEPRGSLMVFSEVYVAIYILNINDEDPVFTTNSIDKNTTINEMHIGLVSTIQAMDTDGILTIPTTFSYSIIFGNKQLNGTDSFSINSNTGIVSVEVPRLDHETFDEYSLIIQAQENQTPKTSILTSLTIFITDINEFYPVFSQPLYQANISETSSIDRVILQVEAIDLDPTQSVSYSFVSSNDSVSFNIDASTGIISLKVAIDRESRSSYTFQVLAVDSDASNPKTATATVNIFLVDVNDNSPRFMLAEMSVDIDEKGSNIPRVIYDVVTNNSITDIDEGVNSQVKYSFQSGESSFSIDADTGLVSVIVVLDFNTQSKYRLTIIATDQSILASDRRTGSFILTVNVNDVNDNSPVLSSINVQNIEENLPAGSIVFTVSATDLDIGRTISLSLSIMDLSAPFNISTTRTSPTFISGVVTTTRSLDFEENNDKTFLITIIVSDGSNSDSQVVLITALDVNDHIPIFTEASGYRFTSLENETGSIGAVNATDLDTGDFGLVNYLITGDNDRNFLIDSTTGVISIQQALEGDPHENYMFSVVASDNGVPPFATVAVVTVSITDINDNPPILRFDNPEVAISEATTYASIFIFIADDNDRNSPNNVVKYFLVDSFPVLSDLSSIFVLNSISGNLMTGTSLPNREDFTEITLTIVAMDGGFPVLSDTTTIKIIINDVNDNVPRFYYPSYYVNLNEDFPRGESFLQVHATESQPDANTQISYSLMNNASAMSNPLQYVNIDSGAGTISLSQSLDFETLPELNLLIIASDGMFTDTSLLTISINNVNDNDPTLSLSTCTQSIPENTLLGQFCILNVVDADADGTTNFTLDTTGFSLSPPLSQFNIIYDASSDVANLFLVSSLDFEVTKSFLLEITVTDKGFPFSRTSSLFLLLNVTGINEFSPLFASPNYIFSMDESENIGYAIGVVTSTDADDPSTNDGVFSYSISSQPASFPFTINASTGLISLQIQVDYELNYIFVFDVYSSDNGLSIKTGTTSVSIFVIDNNENPPVFTSAPFLESIYENFTENQFVVQITATDSDRHDVITYSIIEGNNDGVFRINSNTGGIFTTSISLDFEITQRYVLIVQAADNGTDVRLASTPVMITIIDVNDNAPIFDRPPLNSFVNEGLANLFVMLVSATDLDSTTNGNIEYSVNLISSFEMNLSSGILTTRVPLDRESTSSYLATICASDKGNPTLSICESVTITLLDINDNMPSFDLSSLTNVDIPENTNGGQTIVSLTVNDLDENSIIFFTLENDGGPFSISSSGNTATVILSGSSILSPLDRETRNLYSLTVTAVDQPLSVAHSLQVNVTDVNDEIPRFQNDTYILITPLLENASDGTPVVQVNAIDMDISPNNFITYSLFDSADSRFRINSLDGLISVNVVGGILDFESSSSFTLIVQASDGTFEDTAFVFVPIGDLNDNCPVFLENSYSIQVLETAAIGTTILAVQAIDSDSGNNGDLVYKINSTIPAIINTFEINEVTGILKTSSALDADAPPFSYSFQISASDKSTSPCTTLVDVMITVLEQNEYIPIFTSPVYTASFPENEYPIISFLTLIAIDTDFSANIQYDIVDSGARAYFSLNQTSGQLSLVTPFDREQFAEFTFTVMVSDNETPPRQGFSFVQISLQDKNDNSPIFLLREYSISISESTLNGSTIITVRAIDNDATNLFNQVRYQIASTVQNFSIDPNSGDVFVSGNLDFDQNPNIFSLSLIASDSASIGGNTDTSILFITLIDENDITPTVQNNDLTRTISESAFGGTQVIALIVEDLDTVGVITYDITSGNTNNAFIIDSSGRITVSVNGLDFETVPSFNLGILISDGIHIVNILVFITVTDSNDHAPLFNQESYSISLDENNQINATILNFFVTDQDSGNDGSISLYIDASSNTANMFKLPQITGSNINRIDSMVISALSLDRETPGLSLDSTNGSALWSLKMFAFDNNADTSKRLTSSVIMNIVLRDINDNSPVFSSSSYSAQVSESSNTGTLVLTLSALDVDFGINALINFNFAPGISNSGNFTLNSSSGELRTAAVLSREVSSFIILTIEASDGINKDMVLVAVTITDVNDHNPMFAVPMISQSLNENSPVGTFISDVFASDVDDGDNGRISIFIIGGDPNSQFIIVNIIPGTAQLQVAKDNIDAETQSSYELIIVAQDHGTPTRQGTSVALITIVDVNDNPPIFSPNQYFGTISEDALPSSTVTLNTPIVINDADLGINSQFSISLDNSSIFTINNARTISLNPAIALDREHENSFEILLIVQDMGPSSLSSTATLSISVEDINDNPPIFFPQTYMMSVNEDDLISTPITTVFAFDSDIGANGDISYSILSGSEGKFEIDRGSGLIKTSDQLDRETTDVYNIIVAAFDNGSPFMSGTAPLIVVVTDSNDNLPVFLPSALFIASIEENKIGVDVVDLNASDNDLAENAELSFAFQNPITGSSLPFSIDVDNGEISVTGLLDRETTDLYSFEVVVRDNALVMFNRLTSTAIVIISITDVNDVAPSFPGLNAFMTCIRESTRITTVILSPIATDPDLGNGGIIIYSFSPESPIFSVSNTTGQIILIQSLDFDSVGPNGFDKYQFDLVVSDRGIPSLNSSIPVIICVLDENDNVPVFDLPFYTVGILENITIGTTFIILTAQDNDTNGIINYQIVGGNFNALFEIDLFTGDVSNVLQVSNLSTVIFDLTIRAFESLDITKFSLTSLQIEITDTNDNSPSFCQTAPYEFSVFENSLPNLNIGQICGSDRDSGINGQFEFKIINGNVDSAFDIMQTSGSSTANIVVLNDVLDRERMDIYTLLLQITDKGIPELRSAPIVAIISVLDLNDGTPQFLNLPNSTNLIEGIFGGTEVFMVFADDSDISLNSVFLFEIISGNNGNVFRIEPQTGQIITIEEINFNLNPQFSLTINVTDQGNPSRSNISILDVVILDINDNAPLFMPPYEKSIPEDLPFMSFVILVMAIDADATTNGLIVYNISLDNNGFHFGINSTGHIFLNTTSLDREVQFLYDLVVTACDMGSQVMCSTVNVKLVITDANDHIPIFSQFEYSFAVLENKPAFSIVGTVFALDLDDGSNGNIQYSIQGDSVFNISGSTGEISVLGLDRENTSFYQITVVAEDNGAIPNSNTSRVNITVLDVNDNNPIIFDSVFSSQVLENKSIGSVIFDVDAIDFDLGANSKIEYFILGGSQKDFDINPDSGEVYVNRTLDAERNIYYEIIVQASDNGTPPLSDIKTLVINIIDINEHSPIFGMQTYSVFISENSPVPTFLLNVTATDSDVSGTENSEIFFFLPLQFQIDYNVDSSNGMVTTNIIFDREVLSQVTVAILATNPSSSPKLEGSASIIIIITDVNDQIPYFTMSNYSVEISELSQIGSLVIILTAQDDDDSTLSNSRLTFSSSTENSHEFDSSFRINPNGHVVVNGPLDRESLDIYFASVVVTDQGIPKQSNFSNITIILNDENDIPPTFDQSVYLVSYKEDLDPSSQDGLSRLILNLGFSDGDNDDINKESFFLFANNSPFHSPEFNVTMDGSLFLNIGLDREVRDNYTFYLEVFNLLPGHSQSTFCKEILDSSRVRFINGQCLLFHSSTIYLSVTDINDNFPIFISSPFHFTIIANSASNSEVGIVLADDADESIFSDLLYSITGTSDFTINEITGVLRTNSIFTARVGEVLQFTVSASDQSTNNSLTSTASVIIAVTNEVYLFNIFIDDSVENTRICLDELIQQLRSITSLQVHVSDIQEHYIDSIVQLNRTVVTFYSYQVSESILNLVPQNELIQKIDDNILDLAQTCGGKISGLSSIVSDQFDELYPNIQFFLIMGICAIIFICGCFANILAIYQRVLGKRTLLNSGEYVYGGMQGLDILTNQNDFDINQGFEKVGPIREELTFESQELKMDMFLDEIPDDEFLTGTDMTSSNTMRSNNGVLLDTSIDDDIDLSISSI